MSRTLIVAGVVASALHAAVLAAVGPWHAAGEMGLDASTPIMLTVVELAPAVETEPKSTTLPLDEPPVSIAVSPVEEPIQADDLPPPPDLIVAEPLEPQSEEESATAPETESEPAPTISESSAPADLAISESLEAIPATDVELAERPTPAPTIHQLTSPPPIAILALLTGPLQRAAAPPVKPTPPPSTTSSARPPGVRIDPVLEHRPKPQYPTVARRRSYEGTVVLRIEVLEDGRVGTVEIRRSSGYSVLDRQAERTVRETWRFKPGSVDGRAISLWIDVPIEFRLIDS